MTAMTLWKFDDGIIRKCILIANYSPPNLIPETDALLKPVLNSIASKYHREAIILAGDFNRPLLEVQELGREYGLHSVRPNSDIDWYTHQQTRLEQKQTSELDYLLCNMPMVGLTKEEDNVPITSDHVVITATIA